MTCNSLIRFAQYFFGWLLLSAISATVVAQPLDDVGLEYQNQGVIATISLTGPVQYLRHFPESHGKTLEIYYDRVLGATNNEVWVDNEVRNSPPSGLIPSFKVTSRDQQTKPKLVIEFAREAEFSVAPGKDNRSLLITIQPSKRPMSTGPLPLLPTIMPEPIPVVAPDAEQQSVEQINMQARVLMVQGREALAAKSNEAAVEAFNKLLLLQPNDYTQDAQEWVGVARERAGQVDKAKIEYELSLRLYPEGDGASRVAQRMAGLAGLGGTKPIGSDAEEKKQAPRWVSFGSVSSRYYHGFSQIESSYMFNNAQISSTQSLVDQSMLITSVDASERYVGEEYDGRLVFRDVGTRNFLVNQPGQNRINAAYGEIKSRTKDYQVRLGRQSSTGGGVLGRFDGVSGSYGDPQQMRFNGVTGELSDFSQGSKPTFAGASMDKGPLSFFAIGQRVDGVTDRRAVGTEFRHFEGNKTVFALLDYDTYFKALNAAQIMGTAGAFGGTVSFMVDRRRSPSLSIRNALNGAATPSVNALLQTMSVSSLRELALARTATSNMGQVGISVPLREKWQVGGDVRLTDTTGLPASGNTALEGILPATSSRGTEKSVTIQLIGSGLYKENDIWSGSVTSNTSSEVQGYSVYFYNHTPFNSGWTMDTSLQLYHQKDQYDATTIRTSPMLRGAYRIRERIYFDVDGGWEFADYGGALQRSKTRRFFYSAGLRLDF